MTAGVWSGQKKTTKYPKTSSTETENDQVCIFLIKTATVPKQFTMNFHSTTSNTIQKGYYFTMINHVESCSTFLSGIAISFSVCPISLLSFAFRV